MKTHLTTILIILAVSLCIGSVQGQTLLTETTWGGAGSDVAEGIASAADCRRMLALERNISDRQRAIIEKSYGARIDRWENSDTHNATSLDIGLQIRESIKATTESDD
jgi:hypothetical protein